MRPRLVGYLSIAAMGCAPTERPSPVRIERAAAQAANHALSFTFAGSARIELRALPAGGDRTLVARFLPAHRTTFRAVVLSDPGGQFHLGLAPFASLGARAIELRLGETTRTWPLERPSEDEHGAGVRAGPRWYHLALSFSSDIVRIFLDGELLASFEDEARTDWPLGELVLGRLGTPGKMADQFYGLIDDVGVFDRALEPGEVERLSRAVALEPQSGLVARLSFDGPAGSTLEHVSLLGAARRVEVSRERDPVVDRRQVAEPSHVTRLSLPFRAGETWRVLQSIDSSRSHSDDAAFAIDFERIDPISGRRLDDGARVLAASGGTVVSRVDRFADRGPSEERNLLCLRHAPAEYSCYVHSLLNSALVALGDEVATGQPLAQVGSSGTREPHLHFALSDLPEPNAPGTFSELVTRPFVFDEYLVSSDEGRSFQRVQRGLPRRGQWVRSALPVRAR